MNVFLFLGSRRGYAALKKLLRLQANICGILCLIEDAHETAVYPKIAELAAAQRIPIFFSNEIKSSQYEAVVASCKPDIALVIGWRFLINEKTYRLPPRGTFVLHDSLLPKYRGFAPMNWAIINGEKETGVTLFLMVDAVDAGPIVDQLKITIDLEDTAASVDEKIIGLYEQIIEKNLAHLASGNYTLAPQIEADASFTCKRVPEDGLIDWRCSALQIHHLIRGLSAPFPGAFTYFRGQRVIIWQAHLAAIQPLYVGVIPGRVLGKKNSAIEVLTGEGVLCVDRLQREGEPIQDAQEFSVSVKDTFGLSSQDQR
jgi:methionyl-tRNA formyltransferase